MKSSRLKAGCIVGGALVLFSGCNRNTPQETAQEERAAAYLPGQGHATPGRSEPGRSEPARLGPGRSENAKQAKASEGQRALTTQLKAAKNQSIQGDVQLVDTGKGVQVTVTVKNAPPGEKAVHIHEKADCSDVAGKSMGDHFNPQGTKHGLPTEAEHHIGDLGNIEIGQDGTGKLERMVSKATLKPGAPTSFLGRALVIHEGKDKGVQPSGGAGTPIACGPIEQ